MVSKSLIFCDCMYLKMWIFHVEKSQKNVSYAYTICCMSYLVFSVNSQNKSSFLPWKHLLVQLIPKNDDHSNPSNYRPISITWSLSKVFEVLLNDHFLKYLKNNSLLSDQQCGFGYVLCHFHTVLINFYWRIWYLKSICQGTAQFSIVMYLPT